MTDPIGHDHVLNGILRVLEQIEAKLDGHEARFRSLEDSTKRREENTGHIKAETSILRTGEPGLNSLETPRPSSKGTPVNGDTYGDRQGPLKVPYGKWSINQLDHFNLALSRSLAERLRGCWGMPDDNRLPMRFFRSNVLQMTVPWVPPSESYPTVRYSVERDLETLCHFDERLRELPGNDFVERDLETLCHFDERLREQPGNDFVVVDFDESENTRIYRLGDDAVGSELEVHQQGSSTAPWSRLVLYQGATTGDSIEPGSHGPRQAIPYFTSSDKVVWEHLDFHLQTKRRSTMTNPYARICNGFHTNFYEIREVTEWKVKEFWKHGPLYGHPHGWHFRKCAYTIYPPTSIDGVEAFGLDLKNVSRHWTLLVLAPDHFFDEGNTSFPMNASSLGRAHGRGYPLGRLNQAGAELHLIAQGLERITERWADFLSYFDYILDGGDSLMKPTEHDNLLFDDGAFSRSRRYFWAIDCLSEFELTITDNIAQWELYKAARVQPLERMTQHDQRQFDHVERQYRVLQNQRESFRQKLASTKALRDALFNASAVIESRASTKLGENIKLLTFVSIFFLPLAFTTSLWSVNDQFSMDALIYVIIIVALVTYFIMFNINSLSYGFGRAYEVKKKHVVRAMKHDHNGAWKRRGQQFEVFRPKHENPEPSEWYIPLYALLHPMAILGVYSDSATRKDESGANTGRMSKSLLFAGLASLIGKQKARVEEEGKNEEPWVID